MNDGVLLVSRLVTLAALGCIVAFEVQKYRRLRRDQKPIPTSMKVAAVALAVVGVAGVLLVIATVLDL